MSNGLKGTLVLAVVAWTGCVADSGSPPETDVAEERDLAGSPDGVGWTDTLEVEDAQDVIGTPDDATDSSALDLPKQEEGGTVEILARYGEVVVGGLTPMRALVRDQAGKILGGEPLSWASDTPAVATIDAGTGIVTGVRVGKTTISVTTGRAQGSVEVQVEPAVAEPTYLYPGENGAFYCFLTRGGRLYCRDIFGAFIGTFYDNYDNPPNLTWHDISGELRFKALAAVYGGPVLALGIDGRLHQFGPYTTPQGKKVIVKPTPLPTDVRFKAVASESHYVAALSEDGSLYQLHKDVRDSEGLLPLVASTTNLKFASMSVSGTHTLARTSDGRIYSWNRGSEYSIGSCPDYLGIPKSGGERACGLPTEIATGVQFVSLTAGHLVSFGITADGVAYSWGSWSGGDDPRNNLLHGRGENASPSSAPLPLATSERFTTIVAGRSQVAALRADGVPFFWGAGVVLNWSDDGYVTKAGDYWVPTEREDVRATSLSVTRKGFSYYDSWALYEPSGRIVVTIDSSSRYTWDQDPLYLGQAKLRLTLAQGSAREFGVQPYAEAESMTINGLAFPSAELSPIMRIGVESREPATDGRLEADGVIFELAPRTIAQGHAATTLRIEVSDTARLGEHIAWVESKKITLSVTPPEPPDGTPLDIRCDVAESVVHGYWCLTNSGGATAPHNWKDLPLSGNTWQYQNLCISYGEGGQGEARFKEPSGNITPRPIRYGVLSRRSGVPEVTASGHWLLYHEGIGDPQVEQLTFHPTSGAVGEAWPFLKGSCAF